MKCSATEKRCHKTVQNTISPESKRIKVEYERLMKKCACDELNKLAAANGSNIKRGFIPQIVNRYNKLGHNYITRDTLRWHLKNIVLNKETKSTSMTMDNLNHVGDSTQSVILEVTNSTASKSKNDSAHLKKKSNLRRRGKLMLFLKVNFLVEHQNIW